MKRVAILLFIAALIACPVFAQGQNRGRVTETTEVSGTLKLQNGLIALESGENTYYVPMLSRYVGFIDGLKEGASVSIKGQVSGRNMLHPQELTINNRNYTLAHENRGYGFGNNRNYNHRYAQPYNMNQGRFASCCYAAPNRYTQNRNVPNRQNAPNRTPQRNLRRNNTPRQETPN